MLSLYLGFITGCDHENKKELPLCPDGNISTADAVWSHGNGDLQNTGRAPELRTKACLFGPVSQPSVQWSFELGWPGTISAPVVADDGTIYILAEYPGNGSTPGGIRNVGLFALTPSGALKWFFSKPRDIGTSFSAYYINRPALGADGTIYMVFWDSTLYAINPDGSEKWKLRHPSIFFRASPVIDRNENIYVGGRDSVLCVTKEGAIKWRFGDPSLTGRRCVEISLGKNCIYCAYERIGIIALDYSGKMLWVHSEDLFPFLRYVILVGEDDEVYFKIDDNTLYSLDRKGQPNWPTKIFSTFSVPALRGDWLYFCTGGTVRRFPKDGGGAADAEAIATLSRPTVTETSPLVDDRGIIYVATAFGGGVSTPLIAAVNPDSGLIWQVAIDAAFETSFDGYMALTPEGGLVVASWEDQFSGTNRLYYIK